MFVMVKRTHQHSASLSPSTIVSTLRPSKHLASGLSMCFRSHLVFPVSPCVSGLSMCFRSLHVFPVSPCVSGSCFRATVGGSTGSAYLQALALILQKSYMNLSLEEIHRMVKQVMSSANQVGLHTSWSLTFLWRIQVALVSRVRGANILFGKFSGNYTKLNKTEWGGAGGGGGWRHVPILFTYIRHCLGGIIV